jgi:transcriptional regulator with PAS, ATPase and Fis domain
MNLYNGVIIEINNLSKISEIEKNVAIEAIDRALQTNGYSKTRAAAALGIHRTHLYKKMKKYNMA